MSILEEEKERRRFYENAFLSKMELFGEDDSVITNLADLEPVHRFSTMSSRRKDALSKLNASRLVDDKELTEGERIFQRELNKGVMNED